MSDERYINSSQQRILKVLLAMFGHEVNGIAPGELAHGIGCTASDMTRDLANLRAAGLVEPHPDYPRHWRLTGELPRRAFDMWQNWQRAAQKLTELQHNYTRTP